MSKVKLITEGSEAAEGQKAKRVKKIQFLLNPKSGSETNGTVSFKEENGSVHFEATISGLSEGTHAIHIHEKADCSSKTENQPVAIGILLSKIMALGVLKLDIIEEILVISKQTLMVMVLFHFLQTNGV